MMGLENKDKVRWEMNNKIKIFWLKWKLGHIIRIAVWTQVNVEYAEYIDKVVLINFKM